ncbi:hypothetical protein ABC337_00075 [Arthrobacter sp. 1P04PC]|uniref:hypothetical protein n=1 Tax=Micrococcaceae TaxID=1268 RepID=UPI0039A22544
MAEALASLADAFKTVGVSRAYGESIELAGERVVPVALVSFGFGGGSAPASGEEPGGAGGGGGGFVLPLGVYAGGPNGRSVFRPNPVVLMAAAVPLVCAAGWALRALVPGTRAAGARG